MTQIVWVTSSETVGMPAFSEFGERLSTPFLHAVLAIHPIQNRSGTGYQGVLKSLEVFYLPTNSNNSKSGVPAMVPWVRIPPAAP